jgi:hypothetical protein
VKESFMSSSRKVFRVATGGQTNTIAPPLRNINVYAYHRDADPASGGFEKIHPCPFLKNESLQYPNGDSSGQAGWDVAVPFTSLKDLASQLEAGVRLEDKTERKFGTRYRQSIQRGEIARLAIMAHGDQAGEWYANGKKAPPLTASANKLGNSHPAADYHSALHTIGLYTKPSTSTILLMGCLAGQGRDGTALLTVLSSIWPNRQVVGFDVIGYRFPTKMWRGIGDATWNAGIKLTWFRSGLEFLAQPQRNQSEIEKRWNELPWASEFSKEHAKIVLNQKVIQCPSEEICPVE